MSHRLSIILAITALTATVQPAAADRAADGAPATASRLQVDSTRHYLQLSDGTPFLYLADTAWELFARLSYDEASFYLTDRAEKGFTVIQSVILTELDSITHASEAYLQHIDSVIDKASQLGLYMAIVPTWGDKVSKEWGKGPEIFTASSARKYGRSLARRWKDRPNIIWINGGDRGGDNRREVWEALAEGIREADNGHLITFHPHGEHSSSMWFHDAGWLDFNMIQTSHSQHTYSIYRRLLLPDIARTPAKPVVEGEPRYEDITRDFNPEHGRYQAIDVRKTLYQSMLSGACGYAYGNNNVWQMYDEGHVPYFDADKTWREALNAEGATQVGLFRQLWDRFDFRRGHTARQPLPADDYAADEAVAFALPGALVCYLPGGSQWIVSLEGLHAGHPDGSSCCSVAAGPCCQAAADGPCCSDDAADEHLTLSWMDPTTGQLTRQHATASPDGTLAVTPPVSSTHEDWVIIIEKDTDN